MARDVRTFSIEGGVGSMDAEPRGSHMVMPPGSGIGSSFFELVTWRESAQELRDFEEEKARRNLGKASLIAGTSVLANTLLGGSSMLILPKAYSATGYVLGTVLLMTFAALSGLGAHFLQCSAVRLGHVPSSFEACAKLVLPRQTQWIIDAIVAIKCFGVAISALVVIGDLMPLALDWLFSVNMTDKTQNIARVVSVLVSLMVAGPLACLPNLTALKPFGVLVVVIVLWTVLLFGLFFFRFMDPCLKQETTTPAPVSRRLEAVCYGEPFVAIGGNIKEVCSKLPKFIFLCTCQQNVFAVCNEVQQCSRQRIGIIILTSFGLSGIAWMAGGMLSSATLGTKLEGNALKSYPDNYALQVTRLVWCLAQAVVAYPNQVHPCRLSLLSLYRMIFQPPEDDPKAQRPVHHMVRYWVISLITIASTCSIAILLPNLDFVLGLVGGTGSTMITFIIPGWVYLATFREWHIKRGLAVLQIALGCVIMPFSVFMTVWVDLIDKL